MSICFSAKHILHGRERERERGGERENFIRINAGKTRRQTPINVGAYDSQQQQQAHNALLHHHQLLLCLRTAKSKSKQHSVTSLHRS